MVAKDPFFDDDRNWANDFSGSTKTTDWMKANGIDMSLSEYGRYNNLFSNGGTTDDAMGLKISSQMNYKGNNTPGYYENFNTAKFNDEFNRYKSNPYYDPQKYTATDNFMDTYGKPVGLALGFANEAAKLYGMNKQWDFMDDRLKMMKEDQGMKRELFGQQKHRNEVLGNYQFSPNNTAVV
jgi:hypothetical protein